ncbi:hypothetical protein C8R46DRAFT_500436 [Mycena filopes]|nr:hypothetical protein C8R46DRAFT_500436 [Mycena filopes]
MAVPAAQVAHEQLIPDAKRMTVSEPLSPIHTLAFEMLAEIMVLSLTPRKYTYHLETNAGAKEVLRLCRVCTFWRDVALGTPRLWAAPTLPINAYELGWNTALSQTKMFVERSAPHLVSVSLNPPGSSRRVTVDVSPMLASISHRWKSFKVICRGDAFDLASLARISSNSPKNLEILELEWNTPTEWDGSELDVFLQSPLLRDVTIKLPLATSNVVSMPWTQLTRLSLKYDSPQLCLDILASCTKLVSARINTKQWLESDLPDESYVERSGLLAHLTELVVHSRICSTGELFGPFLRRFRLPALTTLDVSLSYQLSHPDDEHFVPWSVPPLTFLLARSPRVQCLRLGGCVEVEDVPEILPHVANLTELALTDTDVDDALFTALRYYGPDTTPLVPKLDSLLLVEVGEDFDEASFGEMVRSRWWSEDERLAMPSPPIVARLNHIQFYNDDLRDIEFTGFTSELKQTLKEYCSQGLDSGGSNYF